MSDAVRQIKERLSIIDVVGAYVELHKAGKNFKGKSPFSNERTPSFYVSPDRGMYYCFSTSQGGDMFSFIQAVEGVDFKEALKMLAQKANVELVPEAPEKRSEREQLYALLEATTAFFESWLPRCPEATEYLERRGVKAATISKWRIGYAPGPLHGGGWRILKEHLAAKGFSPAMMQKAGVIKPGAEGKDPFDVFRDRIMFPVRDPSGRVVGFSGRILVPDDKSPKYVNSPETELYKKSELLFGYDLAKNSIRTLDFSLIVEGQFDVVMSHQAGYTNTVAVSGTALTPHHVQLLERLSTRVVLALDADRAGIAAMKRAAELMLRRGLDVKVAQLPDGADPADLVQKDSHALKSAVGHAVPIIEFLLAHLRTVVSDDRAYRLRVSEEVLPYLILIPNRIDQEHFVGIVAAALGVSVDAVRFEVERLREQGRERAGSEVSAPSAAVTPSDEAKPEVRRELRENILLYLLAILEIRDAVKMAPLRSAIAAIVGRREDELSGLVSAEALSRTVFELEMQLSKTTDKSLLEDVIAKLNHFRDLTIREAIAERKALLRALEQSGGDLTPILAELTDLERQRKVAPYPEDLFTP